MTLLVVDQLSCIRQQLPLFANMSFQLDAGAMLLVQGNNGSGKSSLLRLLTGLSTPASGMIRWQGKNIQELRADYWEQLHYLGHSNGIKLGLTVLENLQLASYLTHGIATTIDNTLAELQLDAHKHSLAKQLSAGQPRRLALARLFLLPKKLWILDEPLTALDTHLQALFTAKLTAHLQLGGLAVISSHHAIAVNTEARQAVRLSAC